MKKFVPLSTKKLDALCIKTGTFKKSTPEKEKEAFRKHYRKVEQDCQKRVEKGLRYP